MKMDNTKSNPDEYNGWKNYETWAVYSWLSSEPTTYFPIIAIVNDGDGPPDHKVREFVESLFWGSEGEIPATLSTDLLTHSLDRVDWDAVTSAFMDE